ncbi:hypothetical protein HDU67_000351 [Dinochytrium kinnereticum]|nr:hypothetical protein HDU67_000351 [Dinochytrium kinnereticum]
MVDLFSLPEVLERIFSFLHHPDYTHFAITCRSLYEIASRNDGLLRSQSTQKFPENWTPLGVAASSGSLRAVRYILQERDRLFKNLDIDAGCGREYLSPMEWAASKGYVVVCLALMEAGCNAENALNTACSKNQTEVCRMLLSRGCEPEFWPGWWGTKMFHPESVDYNMDPMNPSEEGMTTLHWAAWYGNVELCEMLLDHGFSHGVDCERILDGRTPLGFAALAGRADACRYLVQRGADINAKGDNDEIDWRPFRYAKPPLFHAVQGGSVETCETLLSLGASLKARSFDESILCFAAANAGTLQALEWVLSHYHGDFEGPNGEHRQTALMIAAKKGKVEACRALLQTRKVSIGARDATGLTALHIASGCNKPEIIQLLLEAGADPEIRTDKGLTCLAMAASHGAADCIPILGRVANLEAKCTDKELTPLGMAIVRGHSTAIPPLLECGASLTNLEVNGITAVTLALSSHSWKELELIVRLRPEALELRDESGRTPLMAAAEWWPVDVCSRLIALGAQVNVEVDEDEFTPLMEAVQEGKADVVELLVSHGAKMDRESNKITPLYRAARLGFADVCRVLIDKGCKVDELEKSWTALHGAATKQQAEAASVIAEAMVKAGVGLEARDRDGDTALHIAADKGDVGIVRRLIELGASQDAKNNEGKTPKDRATVKGHSRYWRCLWNLLETTYSFFNIAGCWRRKPKSMDITRMPDHPMKGPLEHRPPLAPNHVEASSFLLKHTQEL